MLAAQDCVAVLASLAAAAIDVRTRRIPNAISIGLIAVGIAAQAFSGGPAAAGIACALVAAIIVVGSFAHARGVIGGGDVKLIAGCVACLGASSTTEFLLFTGIAGGVLALVVSLRDGRLRSVLGNMTFAFVHGVEHLQTSASPRRLPYAVAIAAGLVVTLILRHTSFVRLPL